jgi:hypothetical protein
MSISPAKVPVYISFTTPVLPQRVNMYGTRRAIGQAHGRALHAQGRQPPFRRAQVAGRVTACDELELIRGEVERE